MIKVNDYFIFIILASLNLFTYINVDENLAVTIWGILILWLFLKLADSKVNYPFERTNDFWTPFIISGGVSIGLFLLLSFLLPLFGGTDVQTGNLNSVALFLGSTVPGFAANIFFIILSYSKWE